MTRLLDEVDAFIWSVAGQPESQVNDGLAVHEVLAETCVDPISVEAQTTKGDSSRRDVAGAAVLVHRSPASVAPGAGPGGGRC